MAIEGLTIIGESINDSVPSTHELFVNQDIEGIKALAVRQAEKGAAYIDVNVGRQSPEFMAYLVEEIQKVVDRPLSIDTPDPELAAAGLKAYDPGRVRPQKPGGVLPILNSISPLRPEMFDLYRIQPFIPILLVSERMEDGERKPARNAEETYQTAREMVAKAAALGIPVDQCIIDPGIAPVGTDLEGNLKRLLGALALIHEDPELKGVHISVGLSNFTVMLPSKRPDGIPVKSALESAFLTKAMPLGLDMIIGSVNRKYEILPPDHPAMVCLNEYLELDGFDALLKIKEFYS
ncbi:MAG: dihydropteroate synthase [Firmicutes bacterium]|jgi:cobalamin-dependent methionine synthase I|nr:dihydropteroate synthase [Bacillota bacterium]